MKCDKSRACQPTADRPDRAAPAIISPQPGAMRQDAAAPSAFDQLLARLDENLLCRRLVDNPNLGLNPPPVLLSRLAATAAIDRSLEDLESRGHPWARPVATIVDTVFELLVAVEGARAMSPSDAPDALGVTAVVERVAGAVESLTEQPLPKL